MGVCKSPLLVASRTMSSTYLRLLITILPSVLASMDSLTNCSVYKLNKRVYINRFFQVVITEVLSIILFSKEQLLQDTH